MSFKGHNHSAIAKRKISLENQKNRSYIDNKVIDYLQNLPENDLPTVTDAAIYANISEKRLVLYEASTQEESTIRLALEAIRDLQKSKLLHGGLNRKYDAKITTLLLKANHGLKEESPKLEQTNIFNVSPEILAEAIDLSRKKPS